MIYMNKVKIGCILIALFAVIWVGVYLQTDWVASLDKIGRQILYEAIQNDLSQFFLIIAAIGDTLITAILVFVTAIILWLKDKRLSIWVLSVVTLSGAVVPQIVKYIVARPRPEYGLYMRGGYSFPSGHATGAAVLYGMLITLALLYLKKSWKRNLFVLTATILITLISWSRIYLGVHYTSDVVGGIALGVGQILIWLGFREHMYQKKYGSGETELTVS